MTTTMKEAAAEFLSKKRIAVAGVSRESGGAHGGNPVYVRLRDRGYDVFAVNPNATEVEGDACYPNVATIPGGVDAVVIGTHPDVAESVMQDCIDAGIKHVWMHRGPGAGSVSDSATKLGREAGVTVIDGGCPLMYAPTADFGHKMMRGVLSLVGKVPKSV
jgi:predicted CoA-binding protein